MKPQQDDPCNYCRYWNDDTGCKMGFEYCRFAKPRKENEEERQEIDA